MSWQRYRYYDFFSRSTPKKAKGGIKGNSKRCAFGQSWWAKRRIQVLESCNIGARLGRGRSYACRRIGIDKGRVTAGVQGSRARPYDVVIKVKTLFAANWKKPGKAASGQGLMYIGVRREAARRAASLTAAGPEGKGHLMIGRVV